MKGLTTLLTTPLTTLIDRTKGVVTFPVIFTNHPAKHPTNHPPKVLFPERQDKIRYLFYYIYIFMPLARGGRVVSKSGNITLHNALARTHAHVRVGGCRFTNHPTTPTMNIPKSRSESGCFGVVVRVGGMVSHPSLGWVRGGGGLVVKRNLRRWVDQDKMDSQHKGGSVASFEFWGFPSVDNGCEIVASFATKEVESAGDRSDRGDFQQSRRISWA